MKNNKIITLITAVTFFTLPFKFSNAQAKIYDTTTTNILNEFSGIESVLSNTGYFSFDANYYLLDIDTVIVRDTVYSSYKINGDNMYLKMLKDTVESIQNQNVFATVYRGSKTIVVQKPQLLAKQVMQINVRDSVFQDMAMTSMSEVDSSTDRTITILFDSNAIYKTYKLKYCRTNNRLIYISYSLKKDAVPFSTKSINMYITFTNYAIGTFGDAVFSTDTFFTVNSISDIRLAPGMDPVYEIVNFLKESPDINSNNINNDIQ